MKSLSSFKVLLVAGLFLTACTKKEMTVNAIPSASNDLKMSTESTTSDTLLKVYKSLNMVGPSGGLAIEKNKIYIPWTGPNSNYAVLNWDYNNSIQSFYLPKGYQVVFADSASGKGQSICYVAANSPINMNLPARLSQNISFIRFMPIKSAKKLGTGYKDWTAITALGSSWFYDWGSSKYSTWNPNQMYAPMAWGKAAYDQTHIDTYISKTTVDHILGFNEPDNVNQSNTTPSDAITYYVNLQKTGLRMGAPVTEENHVYGTSQWETDFMNLAQQQNVRVDFIPIHWYDWGNWSSTHNANPDPQYVFNRFKTYVQNVHNAYPDYPIWITEFNANPNRTSSSIHEQFMSLAVAWLNDPAQSYVERYAYFFPNILPAIDSNGNLTSIGTQWKNLNVGVPNCYSGNVIPN